MKIDKTYPATTCPSAVNQRSNQQDTNHRHGFTLVELLVVITIIGILAGLALVGISSAVTTARESAMAFELGQIDQALVNYKSTAGSYPPDASDGTVITSNKLTAINRHLSRQYPQRKADSAIADGLRLHEAGILSEHAKGKAMNYADLDSSEVYVLMLMGFSPDVEFPLTGRGDRQKFYDFKAERLIDPDEDGWYSYKLAYCDIPVVYFNSRYYSKNLEPDPSKTPNHHVARYDRTGQGQGQARPYGTGVDSRDNPNWASKESFQLICAGLDGDFGEGFGSNNSGFKLYPSGLADGANSLSYTLEDRDNITNFAQNALRNKEND